MLFPDTETLRFRPGRKAPPLVCVQWAVDDGPPQIVSHTDAVDWLRWALSHELIAGHNIAYDFAVLAAHCQSLGWDPMREIFELYAGNRVTDTMLRQELADIGRGRYFANGLKYDLGSCARRFGAHADKFDPWRLNYGLLRDVPISQWADFVASVIVEYEDEDDFKKGMPLPGSTIELRGIDALRYALNDPVATRAVYVGQETQRDRGYCPELFVDQFAQARAYWALGLLSTWGLRTSPKGVESLRRGAQEELDRIGEILSDPEILPKDLLEIDKKGRPRTLVRADGSRDTKLAQALMVRAWADAKQPVRLSKTGLELAKAREARGGLTLAETLQYAALDSDACESCGDPLLELYAEYSSMRKVLSADVELLKKGCVVPIHPRYGLAKSGRVTVSKPNTANMRRLAGVRECYVPRGFAD